MTANINPTFYASEFKALLEAGLQQKGSKLRPLVTTGTNVSGAKQAVAVDRVEQVQTNLVSGQFQPKTFTNAQTARRWVLPVSRDLSQAVDHFDLLKSLQDPTSINIQNAMNAHGRDFDDEIIDAFFRDAKTGETGTGTTSFDTTNNQISDTFGASAATRVTVAKLREARRILESWENDFDAEQAFIGLTNKEMDSLRAEAQVQSRDYNDKPILVDGKLQGLMGFNFVHIERLQLDPTAAWRRVPVWMKSGLQIKFWQDVYTNVTKRTDIKGEPYEVYSMATFGATRTDERKVVEIKSKP